MRILHFSDLHIGVENYGRTDPETGLSTRLADFLSSLDEVVEYALTEDVDLVLLAGDAYKGRDPSQTHQREFARRLARLSEASPTATMGEVARKSPTESPPTNLSMVWPAVAR